MRCRCAMRDPRFAKVLCEFARIAHRKTRIGRGSPRAKTRFASLAPLRLCAKKRFRERGRSNVTKWSGVTCLAALLGCFSPQDTEIAQRLNHEGHEEGEEHEGIYSTADGRRWTPICSNVPSGPFEPQRTQRTQRHPKPETFLVLCRPPNERSEFGALQSSPPLWLRPGGLLCVENAAWNGAPGTGPLQRNSEVRHSLRRTRRSFRAALTKRRRADLPARRRRKVEWRHLPCGVEILDFRFFLNLRFEF